MPTYEYACSNCDTTHEVQQKMTDPTLTDCPSCGQSTLRKLFSGVGIHFKGSGFYRTDSRDSKSATAPAASSSRLVVERLVLGLVVERLVRARRRARPPSSTTVLQLVEHPGGQLLLLSLWTADRPLSALA